MAIRTAEASDVAAIRRVAEQSWERDYPDIVSRETATAGLHDWYDETAISEEVDRPDAVVLVAEEEDDVVGFVHGVYSDGEGHLLRVYVDPDRREEGFGADLVAAATKQLTGRGADRVRAMVLAENEAGNAFYESLGFERLEETFETEIGDGFYEECVWVSGE